jgi:hypothetical protein
MLFYDMMPSLTQKSEIQMEACLIVLLIATFFVVAGMIADPLQRRANKREHVKALRRQVHYL